MEAHSHEPVRGSPDGTGPLFQPPEQDTQLTFNAGGPIFPEDT
jgi:hypothetical protein